MKKAELMKYVGSNVTVVLFDDSNLKGILGYADEFSAKHGYRKVNMFYIGDYCFRVSHVRKVRLVSK